MGIHGGFFGSDLDLVRQRERERKRGAKERGLRVREREERNEVLSKCVSVGFKVF